MRLGGARKSGEWHFRCRFSPLAKAVRGTFDPVFRRSPDFTILLSHVVGSGRISRELNVGVGNSLDSAGNAEFSGFRVQFRRKEVFFVAPVS